MNREGIRRLAAEELSLPTSATVLPTAKPLPRGRCRNRLSLHREAGHEFFRQGQSFIRSADQLTEAWNYAQQAAAQVPDALSSKAW
jgi:phosphoribosylglycinamide formyltransferase 2